MMLQNVPLDKGDVAIEPFFDAIQEMVGPSAANFRLKVQSATAIRAEAGSGSDQASISVDGFYRLRTTNIDASHPGGAASSVGSPHFVYVTAAANNFTGPNPHIDLTDYSFGLVILASGTPGGVDHYRRVAEVDWDGTKITALRQTVGAERDGQPVFAVAPLAHLAAGTFRAATSATGSVLRVETAAAAPLLTVSPTGVLGIGADTNLYRLSSGVLKTDSFFLAGGSIVAYESAAQQVSIGAGGAGTGAILFGAALDVGIYRVTSGVLKTNARLLVDDGIGVGGSAAATTPGSVVRKIPVYDETGGGLGYLPVYNAIA